MERERQRAREREWGMGRERDFYDRMEMNIWIFFRIWCL
jgi:hypothetical protein